MFKYLKHFQTSVANSRCVVVFQLLGVDVLALGEALTHKKLTAKGEEVTAFVSVLLAYSLLRWRVLRF